MRILMLLFILSFPLATTAAEALDEVNAAEALDEVNAARAVRGLPPFARDEGLTVAAQAAAKHRAERLIPGHVPGQLGDFAFLPADAKADAAGCAAWEPGWGWGACCTYENYQQAGAAWAQGTDGRRYMHLFVSGGTGSPSQQTATATRVQGRRGLFRR